MKNYFYVWSFLASISISLGITESLEAKTFIVQITPHRSFPEESASVIKCAAKALEASKKADFRVVKAEDKEGFDVLVSLILAEIESGKQRTRLGWSYAVNTELDIAAGADNEQKIQLYRDLKQLNLPRSSGMQPQNAVYSGRTEAGNTSGDLGEITNKSGPCESIVTSVEQHAADLKAMAEWAKRNIGNEAPQK